MTSLPRVRVVLTGGCVLRTALTAGCAVRCVAQQQSGLSSTASRVNIRSLPAQHLQNNKFLPSRSFSTTVHKRTNLHNSIFSKNLMQVDRQCLPTKLMESDNFLQVKRQLSSTTSLLIGSNLMPKSRTSLTAAQLNALRFKTRKIKKKVPPMKDEWSVVGYSAAESFDIMGIQEGLRSQLIYKEVDLVEELHGNCICVTNKYAAESEDIDKEIYLFKDGNVVFWNVPELERNSVLKFLVKYSIEGYDEDLIYEESEMMNFAYSENINQSHLDKGVIRLNVLSPTIQLDKYTFSDAIASSVKLGAWEASLDKIISSIEHISEDLKTKADVKISSSEVLQKSGEILALRHVINLSSDLLDTPDFYWDREGLENMYLATCSHLAVGKRIKIVNEKLNHCLEVMDLVSTHLSNEHGARLEWIIIILIAIEIGFEVLHLVERKFGGFSVLDPTE